MRTFSIENRYSSGGQNIWDVWPFRVWPRPPIFCWPSLEGSGWFWLALESFGRLWKAVGGSSRLWTALDVSGSMYEDVEGSRRTPPYISFCVDLAAANKVWDIQNGARRTTFPRPDPPTGGHLPAQRPKSPEVGPNRPHLNFKGRGKRRTSDTDGHASVVQTRLFRFGTNLRCEQKFGIR